MRYGIYLDRRSTAGICVGNIPRSALTPMMGLLCVASSGSRSFPSKLVQWIIMLKSLVMVKAEAVLSSIVDRAKAALVAFLSIIELRSYLESDKHRPR